jgi:hypothetical protein
MTPEHRATLEDLAAALRGFGPLHAEVADCLMADARAGDAASARTRLVGLGMAMGLGRRPEKGIERLRRRAIQLAEALGAAS